MHFLWNGLVRITILFGYELRVLKLRGAAWSSGSALAPKEGGRDYNYLL